MPIYPGTIATNGVVTAKFLNANLYSYAALGGFSPNGIAFLSSRQLLIENLSNVALNQGSSSAGTFTSLQVNGDWLNNADTAALWGGGGDTAWETGTGRYNPAIPSSSGTLGISSGYHLIWGYPNFSGTTNAGGSGASLNENGTRVYGGIQLSSTTHNNGPYVLDIVETQSGQYTYLEGYCSDSSNGNYAYAGQQSDYSGQVTKFYGTQLCCDTNNGVFLTAPPTPPAWTAASTVTSSVINGSAVMNPLSFMYNPPVLRASGTSTVSIIANTTSVINLSSGDIDNYTGFSGNTYTVQVTGVYLAYGYVYYNNAATGNLYAGIRVNGSSTPYWGPAASCGATGNHAPQVVRLLDLQRGDTVQLVTQTSAGATLGNQLHRMCLAWMSTTAGSNGSISWTLPDPSFRWQAGTPGSNLTTSATNLTAQFQTHLTNDLSFFLQRPYLMTYQSTAQTGLAHNVQQTIVMDTVGGVVHGSAGDNYGGWTSGVSNLYTAPVNGWYLVQASYSQNALTSGTASCIALISPTPAGAFSPDTFQHQSTTSTNFFPGAEALGVYYLRAGDSVAPVYEMQDGGATFNTIGHTGNAGHECNFGVVWLCE